MTTLWFDKFFWFAKLFNDGGITTIAIWECYFKKDLTLFCMGWDADALKTRIVGLYAVTCYGFDKPIITVYNTVHYTTQCSVYFHSLTQVILFEIDCAFFYTNLHKLSCQFISWTNWVNSGKFMDNCWISCYGWYGKILWRSHNY